MNLKPTPIIGLSKWIFTPTIALLAFSILIGSGFAQETAVKQAAEEPEVSLQAEQDGAQAAGANEEGAKKEKGAIQQGKSNAPTAEMLDAKTKKRAELEAKLAKYLSGTKFIGKFTVDGREDDDPKTEEYEIQKIEKMEEGDYWKLTARIKYGKNDRTETFPMEIKWAGETPVLTVDKLKIPFMGTFDARVVIRRGKYAGTWAHDQVGGHLFGRIEKLEAKEDSEKDDSGKEDPANGDAADRDKAPGGKAPEASKSPNEAVDADGKNEEGENGAVSAPTSTGVAK